MGRERETHDLSGVIFGPVCTCPGCGAQDRKWSGCRFWQSKTMQGSSCVFNGWAYPEEWKLITANVPGLRSLRVWVCSTRCGAEVLQRWAARLPFHNHQTSLDEFVAGVG